MYATKMKVLIIADLMNYHIIIIENTQTQYFDNLTRYWMGAFSTMTIHSCIKFANTCINKCLVSCCTRWACPVFCQKKDIVNEGNLPFIWALFTTIYSLCHCYIFYEVGYTLWISKVHVFYCLAANAIDFYIRWVAKYMYIYLFLYENYLL